MILLVQVAGTAKGLDDAGRADLLEMAMRLLTLTERRQITCVY